MYKIIIITILTLFIYTSKAQDSFVVIVTGDNQGLITAIENANNGTGPAEIYILPGDDGETTFTFTEAYMGGENALPTLNVSSGITLLPFRPGGSRISFERDATAPQFRLFEVTGDDTLLRLGNFNVEGFAIDGNGGAILASGSSKVDSRGTSFRNNFASGEGGAIYMGGSSTLLSLTGLRNTGEFTANRAGTVGGAVSIQDSATASVVHMIFADNVAGIFGCDINVNSSGIGALGQTLSVYGSTFAADCDNVLIENPAGRMNFLNNSFAGRGDVIDSTALVNLFGNIFATTPTSVPKSTASKAKAVCNDFGTNAFNSLGYNISNESSCMLDQDTDLPDTNPMIIEADEGGVIALQSGSPAIDAGAFSIQENPEGADFLPCGYVDSRGLGRPQDGNGDGVFECDMGSYEVQGGPDLTFAQSGLYFDTNRNGEGIRVEMLSDGRVLVAMFTFDPNGNDLMWLLGVGKQVGNSVVIDEVYRTDGGAFGAAFNPDTIKNNTVGSMSLVFPNCEANDQPGRLLFESDKSVENPMEDLLVEASTISRVLSCNQTQLSDKSGRSGAFFDPQRSGEGIFIDVISDQTAVIYFFTFTPTGEQYWLLGSAANISGNTITADMVYPSSTTGFGSEFNADDVVLSDWGTLTITGKPGCNNLTVSYNSVIPAYGSGSYDYTRITQSAGTTCDL